MFKVPLIHEDYDRIFQASADVPMLWLKRSDPGNVPNTATLGVNAQYANAMGTTSNSPSVKPYPNAGQPQPHQKGKSSDSRPQSKVHYTMHPQVEPMAKKYVFNEMPIHLLHVQTKKIFDQNSIWLHLQSAMRSIEQNNIPPNLRYPGEDPVLADVVALIDDLLGWAILSHRWGASEPTYQEVKEGKFTWKPGHLKLKRFCTTAYRYGAEFVWSDTCCINKENKAEYDRSIRSMYRWYANSPLCIVHLANTTSIDDFENDEWFTRGWTLQELLAPKKLKFYGKDWRPLTNVANDKESQRIAECVERATSITWQDFRRFLPCDRREAKYEISKRMRWAARRETTVPEDRAYCLMGIFGVSMYIDRGEGEERAVGRLMAEILQFSNSPEVLNWAGTPGRDMSFTSYAFPSLVECFNGSNDPGTILRNDEELSMTPRGLRVDLLVFTAKLVSRGRLKTSSIFKTVAGEVSVEVLDHHDLQGDRNEYAFGVWNFNSSTGRCVPTGPTFEAILLKRHDTGHPASEWAKVCTKHFARLESMDPLPPEGGWAALRQKIWV